MIWIKIATGWALDAGSLSILLEIYDSRWTMICKDVGIERKVLPLPTDAPLEAAQAAALHIVKQRVIGILQAIL